MMKEATGCTVYGHCNIRRMSNTEQFQVRSLIAYNHAVVGHGQKDSSN